MVRFVFFFLWHYLKNSKNNYWMCNADLHVNGTRAFWKYIKSGPRDNLNVGNQGIMPDETACLYYKTLRVDMPRQPVSEREEVEKAEMVHCEGRWRKYLLNRVSCSDKGIENVGQRDNR